MPFLEAISQLFATNRTSRDDPQPSTSDDRSAKLILFPRQDHNDLRDFENVKLGSSGDMEYHAFDAHDCFCVLRTKRVVTWNLERGSSMVNGTRRDGSYVVGCQVVIPSELLLKYPTFNEYLRNNSSLLQELDSPSVAKFKERYSIRGGGTDVEAWRLPHNQLVTNDNWRSYASPLLFPLLKTAANGDHMFLQGKSTAVIIREISVPNDLYSRLARLKTLETYCLPSEKGVVVAAPWRLVISVTWFLVSIAAGILSAFHKRDDWYDSVQSFFTATTLIAVTLPALAALLIQEPDLIRNAIRGKRTLTSDQEVASWFGFVEKDYAAAAISLSGTFLVSEGRGCFLSGKANPALSGDGYLVTADTLQQVGVFVGRAIDRRIWENKNKVTEEIDRSVSHLTDTGATRNWAAGTRSGRLVGGPELE